MTARWLLVLVGIGMMARRVDAECATPRVALSPPTGTALPADPTLYLFTPVWGQGEAPPPFAVRDAFTDAPVGFHLRTVSASPSLIVRELRVEARDRAIEVVYAADAPPAVYAVLAEPGLSHRRVEIRDVRYERDYWSCSHTDAAVLSGRGNAAAYRLEWLDGAGIAYLPPSTEALYRAPSAEIELAIGHVSCLGDTVDSDAFALEQRIRVVALFADGTSLEVGGGDLQLASRRVLPWPLLGAVVGDAEPAAAPAPIVREPIDATALLIASLPTMASILIAVVAAGWLSGRRRRRALARHPVWPAALLLVGVLATAHRAEASCRMPGGAVSPPTGSALPADPTVYLFEPGYWSESKPPPIAVRDAITGEAIPFDVRFVDEAPGLGVREVHIAARGRVIELVSAPDAQPVRYVVATAAALPHRRVEIDDVRHVRDYWTCSYTDAVVLTGRGNAAAYRLEWLDGGGRVAYLPPAISMLFGRDQRAMPWAEADVSLEIGHVSCLGDTVDAEAFRREQDVRLVALFTDGTSLVVGAGALQLGETQRALPWALMHAVAGDQAPLADPPRPPRRAASAITAAAMLFAAMPAIAAMLIAGLLSLWAARHQRRRALARHPAWPPDRS